MNDLAFVSAARQLIGTPWRDRGRSLAGVDCLGLIALSARQCGHDEAFAALVGSPRDYHALKPVMCRFAQRVADVRPGALLIYRREELGIVHVGIASMAGQVIHIPGPGHVVSEAPLGFAPRQIWGLTWPS
jgi:cell wall-associated NlpC family hydrolase